MTWTVAALYKFVEIKDRESLQASLRQLCEQNDVYGSLLIANEGVNGTICAPDDVSMKKVIDFILAIVGEDKMELKYSTADLRPFRRLKIRLKKEIVTLRQDHVDPTEQVGTYLSPQEWNELLRNNPDMPVIDTRNDYEVEIGTFQNAIDPKTKVFTEFPEFVQENFDPKTHKKVAMFCTGGIRCEKSTSFLRAEGIEDVFHLKGGILKYLEEVPPEESKWQGDCFVFDERVTVRHGLEPGEYGLCRACRRPVSAEDMAHPDFEEGVSCPHCMNERTEEQRARYRERQRQEALARKRGTHHVGATFTPEDD